MDAIEDVPPPVQEQTTLLHDEEESFALAPVDASALKGENSNYPFLKHKKLINN